MRASPVVRRVRDLNKKAAEGQDELFAVWRYHPVFTDSRSLTSRPGFTANAAWLAIAAMAHNSVRAASGLASLAFARAGAATVRRDPIAVAARTARLAVRVLTRWPLPDPSLPDS
jgi:hypothetical protein